MHAMDALQTDADKLRQLEALAERHDKDEEGPALWFIAARFRELMQKELDGAQPRNTEEEALRWLARSYRDTETDERKYTRWNMAVAYAAGKERGLIEPTPTRPCSPSQLSALVTANDALRFLYGHDLGEAIDMIVQEAFTATSVALADGRPMSTAAQ